MFSREIYCYNETFSGTLCIHDMMSKLSKHFFMIMFNVLTRSFNHTRTSVVRMKRLLTSSEDTCDMIIFNIPTRDLVICTNKTFKNFRTLWCECSTSVRDEEPSAL